MKSSPRRAETHALARKWIAECLNEHDHVQTLPDMVPSRLIEITHGIGDAPHLRLLTNVSQSVPYVALSYCWGGDQRQKLTTQNLHKYQNSIPFESLSKSVQDAIEVTRNLEFKYVWIDCLCIIQDMDADKIVEVAKMPNIYSRAVVTIAASSASGAEDGFLGERRDVACDGAVRLKFRDRGGRLEEITAFHLIWTENTEPLNKRGWTLPERLLSMRILDYTSRQVRFTCPVSDKNPCVDGWMLHPDTKLHAFHDLVRGKLKWQDAVDEYSSRQLTLPADRPLAISGIAYQFEAHFPEQYSTYIAGLWASQLPQNLLWSCAGSIDDQRRRNEPASLPSWSWTAVDGSVTWNHKVTRESLSIKIISHDIELEDRNAPYGRCTTARLRLEGLLLRAWCSRHVKNRKEWLIIQDDDNGTIMSRPLWDASESDFPREKPDGQSTYCSLA
jgi:hypothetical protein